MNVSVFVGFVSVCLLVSSVGHKRFSEQTLCALSPGLRVVKQPPRCTGCFTVTFSWVRFFTGIFCPLGEEKIFSDSLPVWFIFQEFQPRSFHGPNLAVASIVYLFFGHRVDSVCLTLLLSSSHY